MLKDGQVDLALYSKNKKKRLKELGIEYEEDMKLDSDLKDYKSRN
jgi:hypothetical protein